MMKQNNTVIILVNYNSWQDTIECVNSLIQIKSREYTVIVLDNCSKDDSFLMLEKKLTHNSNLILLKSEFNGGFAMGNNIAINYARKHIKPDYIWLLNNDTIIKEDALSPMIEFLERNKEVGIVGSKLLYFTNPDTIQAIGGRFHKWYGKMEIVGFNEKDIDQYKDFDEPLDFIIGASMLIHESLIDKVGALCEDYFLYFEEIDWSIRARKIGLSTKCCTKSVVYHKEGSSTGSDSRDKVNINAMYFHLRNLRVFYNKFYPRYAVISILVITYRIVKSSILKDRKFIILLKEIFFQKPRYEYESPNKP